MIMDSAETTTWYTWAVGGFMSAVTIFLAYLIAPIKKDVADLRRDYNACHNLNAPLVFHLKEESDRHTEVLDECLSALEKIKVQASSTETKVGFILETNKRIENKIDKLL